MQERSEAERRAIMAMPQCCYLAKGAKRPSPTTNTIKFDRIPFDLCNSIKRFDLCPFDQKNSTYLQPPIFANEPDLEQLRSVRCDATSGLKRDSNVFIRNFVRAKKSDPLVKGKGVVKEILSPQLAEVEIKNEKGKSTEFVNTRHIAPAPSAEDSSSLSEKITTPQSIGKRSIVSESAPRNESRNESNPSPRNKAIENIQNPTKNTNETSTRTRYGRTVRKPKKTRFMNGGAWHLVRIIKRTDELWRKENTPERMTSDFEWEECCVLALMLECSVIALICDWFQCCIWSSRFYVLLGNKYILHIVFPLGTWQVLSQVTGNRLQEETGWDDWSLQDSQWSVWQESHWRDADGKWQNHKRKSKKTCAAIENINKRKFFHCKSSQWLE